MTLSSYQKQIDDWAKTLKDPYWSPHEQLARVTEEVGELARLINHMYGSKPKKASEAKQELGEELADIIFAVACIANRHKIDLDKEFEEVMQKSHVRDEDRFEKANTDSND